MESRVKLIGGVVLVVTLATVGRQLFSTNSLPKNTDGYKLW